MALTFIAARERLESSGDYYRPFQLFGYDFLVDTDLRIWLCEINSSPAVAEHLLPALVDALVATAIDPFFPPVAALARPSAPPAPEARQGFELVYAKPRDV